MLFLWLLNVLILVRGNESKGYGRSGRVSNVTLPWQNEFKDDNFIQDPEKTLKIKTSQAAFNSNSRNIFKVEQQNLKEDLDNADKKKNIKLKDDFDSKDRQNADAQNNTYQNNPVKSNSTDENRNGKQDEKDQELDSLFSNSLESLEHGEKEQKQFTDNADDDNEHQNRNLEEDNEFDSLRDVLQRRTTTTKKLNKQNPTTESKHPDNLFDSPAVMEKLQPIIRSQLRTKTYMTLLLNGYKRVHYLKTLLNQMMTADMCQRLKVKDGLSPTNSLNTWKKAALIVNEFERKCSAFVERKRRNHLAKKTRRHRFK